MTITPSAAVMRVLDGAVDLHCHSGPSPFPRRINHVEAAHDAARIGLRAILVKSHHHNTVMDLLAMAGPLTAAPTPVYGGVALNSEVGGINPSAVAMSLRMGGRCVWAPTVSARQHIDHHAHAHGFPTSGLDLLEEEVSIFDDAGAVSAATVQVTRVVAEAGALLTGGHLDVASQKALFEVAVEQGVRRLLVQHPDFIVGAAESDVEELLGMGAFVEHEIAMYHPDVAQPDWPIEQLVGWIERIGPERTTIGSDLGQQGNPLPVDGYLWIVQALLDHGVSEKDVRRMVADNPAYLLGLDDERPS
ncbi:DUF6282 family protein [Dactylosporangium sp. NPDC005572]|uniref:DUF6282 family protein n=1 Tax=Dactylosporangium sp. NPDC005572 TaxID=3156889 RepID=UPI0033AF4313